MSQSQLLFGRDQTAGIVSVSADREGRAVVWRREGELVFRQEERFCNWFLVRDPQLLADLPLTHLSADRFASGWVELPSGLGLVELEGSNPFRYLVLTDRLPELEPIIVGVYGKRGGEQARSLSGLRGEVYWRPPVEQYLILTGRTYFKGMAYDDLRRLQFDLETTGLDKSRDRIFMISILDSTGFRTVLDTAEMSERELLEAFVTIVRERDPDVLENHNLFEFDIPFLVQRAAALGVRLGLGRDGGTFSRMPDQVKIGERSESFTRYALNGREIVDTLHTVKRYGAIVRDLRYHGLKQAARYFGFAKDEREYVEGSEIWNTFQVEPERVRRYSADDVEEVDGLSRLLLGSPFALASMVPKPYERIATAGTGQGLIEPLLVRAYLSMGYSLPEPQPVAGTFAGGHTEVFTSGVVRHVVKADVASLYPSIMLSARIGPRTDELGAFLSLLDDLTRLRLYHKAEARRQTEGSRERLFHEALQGAMKVLINSFYGSLGTNFALFGDREAAAEVTRRGREILELILAEFRRRGHTLIEADTDGVFFSVPSDWTEEDEVRLVTEVGLAMPDGIHIEHDGRYRAMYSYAEKNYVLQEYDGRLRVVGGAFRSAKYERYTERFLREAVSKILEGETEAIRPLYQEFVAGLRARAVGVDELCITITLSKSPEQYKKAQRREEQYEVLLSAGQFDWRPGQRIRYYRSTGGQKRLVEEFAGDYDVEYYVNRLRNVALQRLSKAVGEEELKALLVEEGQAAATDGGRQPAEAGSSGARQLVLGIDS